MSHDENALRERLCSLGRSMFERGLTAGSSGNLSVRLPGGGWLMTPTNASLGRLDPARLARLDAQGRHVDGDAPTKEAALHTAVYGERPASQAVVHLHSTWSVAVSMLRGIDSARALPALTPYFVMKIGRLPLLPYHRPGDPAVAQAIRSLAASHVAVLLANHGPVVSGDSLEAAVDATEELEETAKLFMALQGRPVRELDDAQIDELRRHFKVNW